MFGKGSSEVGKKQSGFWAAALYYIVVLCLLTAIILMTINWRNQRKEYSRLVQEASAQDQGYAIELQKNRDLEEEDSDKNTEDTIQPIKDQDEGKH